LSILYDAILSHLPARRKHLPSGWISFNCPVCHEVDARHKHDTDSRGGLRLEGNSIILNCFNCGFKAVWTEGNSLTKKMRFYLTGLGATPEEIRKINFNLWQRKSVQPRTEFIPRINITFNKVNLPNGAMPFYYWESMDHPPVEFQQVSQYVLDRGSDIYKNYEYYWTPDKKFKHRVIIPFIWKEDIVGWTARSVINEDPKYYASTPSEYLFNNRVLYMPERKYVIIVEGAFDAISIDGIASLGNKLSPSQISWIKQSGKEIIVVLDKDDSGENLTNVILENNWSVSVPRANSSVNENGLSTPFWERNIVKDTADAVKRYGRLYTLSSILENKTNNKSKIQLALAGEKKKKVGNG
jgi:hypothetical protein